MIEDRDLAITRRRLQFRAWHRGTREADLLLGPFADAYLPACTPEQVEAFARLLEVEDPDLWDWVTGQKPPEAAHDGPVLATLMKFIKERRV
jgi:antitoxin CptB